MPAYGDNATIICRAALDTVCGLLSARGISYRVIGGSAVLAVLDARGKRATRVGYVGTLDVDIAAADGVSRAAAEQALLEADGWLDPDDSIRIWLPIDVEGEVVDAPIDLLSSTLVAIGPAPVGIPTLALPALLLAKLRPYEHKGAKGKDGYDAYMLLAYGAETPEELAREAAELLPPEMMTELLKLVTVFFLMKRRAARDAAMLMRDYHGAAKSHALRDAVSVAERFVVTLRGLLDV